MITTIAPANGGVAHVARCVAEEWRRRGERVVELVVGDDGTMHHTDHARADREPQYTHIPVAFRAAVTAWRHRRCCLATVGSLHVELGRTARATFWFALAAGVIRPRVPMVVVAHDMPVVTRHASAALMPVGGRWLTALTYRVIVPLLDTAVIGLLRRRADATVVLAAGAAADARSQAWPMVSQVAHGADPASSPTFDPMAARTVLLAGYLAPGKGLDVLAQAWSMVDEHDAELSLVVAGSVADADREWFASIREQMEAGPRPPIWLGYVSDDEFADLIARAAVVVLPYEVSNPASGPLVRALVEGRPVVASRVPAVADELVDGVNGFVVEPGDAGQLADALRRLMNDGALRRAVGKSAAAMAAGHSWPDHVAALAEVHGAAVGSSGTANHQFPGKRVDEDAT